jgi:Flp pilus assembly secretin CpaC
LLLAIAASAASAQQTSPQPGQSASPSAPAPLKKITAADKRRAAKLFFEASRLFEKEQFEEALKDYRQAAALDPSNSQYPLAVQLARSHAVNALIQSAAKDRILGNAGAARAALVHALEFEPQNTQVALHLSELGDDQLLGLSPPIYERGASTAGSADELAPTPGTHSFHLRTDQRQMIQQVFKAYGISAAIDQSVRATQGRLDLDDATFAQATRTLAMLTNSFYVSVDAHRVLVARDTNENRQQFMRQELETIYLPGLSQTELTEVGTLAKSVFDIPQSVVEQSAGTITVRGPEATLNAFNSTLRELIDGRNQVLLEVRMIQIAHTGQRNTGVQLPQQMAVFNVYAEAQSILNSNQSLVQQIISSGLAAPGDYLAIIAILIASGQVSNPLLSGGFATFGGGNIATFGLAPGTTTANLTLNSSDSRALDEIQLRLGDGEAGTVRTGVRYPIQTSSYSNLSTSGVNIPGLTGAGTSSALSSLLASASSVPPVPQVEYQDLGLTLKATPKVMRNDEVALTIDMKIDALAGSSLNGNPILDNRAYSGVVTLKQGEGVVVVSELDKQETRAVSGTPGITEIPGLNSITGNDNQKNYSTLLIVITPHVLRGTQLAGHSPMMRVERSQQR